MTDTAYQKLLSETPWPDTVGVRAWDFTLGGGGRQLIDEIIKNDKPQYMLEVGCFLGASAKRWLALDPDLKMVGLDTWSEWLKEQCKKYVGRPGLTRAFPDIEVQKQFAADVERQGPFPTCMANLKGLEDRFVPYRGMAPDALFELKEKGFEPDLIYIDADKKPEPLDVCAELWPDARITGDDWHWNRTKGFPMRKIVYEFAERHGLKVNAQWATWVTYRD